MRIFTEFPHDVNCPVCGINENKPCVLVAIDGTAENGNEEALPVHVACLELRINQKKDIIYQTWEVK